MLALLRGALRARARAARRMPPCRCCGGAAAQVELLRSLPEGGDAAAALRALRGEVAGVGALPCVEWVDPPAPMGAAEQDGSLFVPTDKTGPWFLRVGLAGPPGPYEAGYTVQVKCNSAYPQQPPELRVCGVIHHPRVDDGGVVDPDALTAAAAAAGFCEEGGGGGDGGKGDGGCALSVRRAVLALHMLLRTPAAFSGDDMPVTINEERLSVIDRYRPQRRHADLYDTDQGWQEGWFAPELWAAAEAEDPAAWRALLKEEFPEVYSFPCFTPAFCDRFVEELRSFYASGLPARRPNSMNNYGVVLNEIGLEPMLTRLQREFLQPLARAIYPGAGSHFDRHHSFIVRYKMGEDLGLDMHVDDSDVTFNICLGLDFDGAGLQFCGNLGHPRHRHASGLYRHVKGRCVCHLGRRRHGADDITRGERLNLIVWNHGSEYRRTDEYTEPDYAKEAAAPDPVCVSFTHDRDFGVFREYNAKSMDFRGRGWCPPRHAEYTGFHAESRTARLAKAARPAPTAEGDFFPPEGDARTPQSDDAP